MIEDRNPCGIRGIAFVEVAAPDPGAVHRTLIALGFSRTHRHARLAIDLYEQGQIRILLNRMPDGAAAAFAAVHGPSVCSIGWWVADSHAATAIAEDRGAQPAGGDLWRGDATAVPAVFGVGDTLIYLLDPRDSWLTLGFLPIDRPHRVPGAGLVAIDHLTNNVPRGRLAHWAGFYRDVFGFTDVRYFDIRGAKTGLHSFALRSPCETFCIPINEGTETGSQIDEYLDAHSGPGIQHVAFLTQDILATLRALDGSPIETLDIDADYYTDVFARVPNVREDHAEIARRRVLVDGDRDGYLLQIFTKNLLGPTFIELIQRRNHLAFGEGNFGALFRSIERDQIKRGYLT